MMPGGVVFVPLLWLLEWCCVPPSPLVCGAAWGGPTFLFFFGVVLPLFVGAAFSSLLFGGAALPCLLWDNIFSTSSRLSPWKGGISFAPLATAE